VQFRTPLFALTILLWEPIVASFQSNVQLFLLFYHDIRLKVGLECKIPVIVITFVQELWITMVTAIPKMMATAMIRMPVYTLEHLKYVVMV